MREEIKKVFFKDQFNNNCKKLFILREKIEKHKKNIFIKTFLMFRYQKLLFKNNCFIPLTTKIGNNIIFPHGVGGVYFSSKSIIGDNCVIFQQVTIGSNTLKDSKNTGSPKIGDNVYIGAGAKIIGNIRIGNNVRIGANAVVVKDVPDNCTVVASGTRIIKHSRPKDNKFVPIDKL